MANVCGTNKIRLGFSWVLGAIFLATAIFCQSRLAETVLYEGLEQLGCGLVVVATLGRIWSMVYIGGRKDAELCQDGPYSIWRNPLYLFSFIGAVGIILCAQILLLLFIIMPFFLYNYYFVIKSEERRLLEMFGEPYRQYCRKVKRIIPNFANYHSQEKFEVYPRVLFRSMVHASFFMWLVIGLDILEYFKETGLLPIFITVSF